MALTYFLALLSYHALLSTTNVVLTLAVKKQVKEGLAQKLFNLGYCVPQMMNLCFGKAALGTHSKPSYTRGHETKRLLPNLFIAMSKLYHILPGRNHKFQVQPTALLGLLRKTTHIAVVAMFSAYNLVWLTALRGGAQVRSRYSHNHGRLNSFSFF